MEQDREKNILGNTQTEDGFYTSQNIQGLQNIIF